MTSRGIAWSITAVLGIACAAAVAWTAGQLAGQHIGLSSEPLAVAQGLAPTHEESRTVRRRNEHRLAGRQRPTQIRRQAPAPTTSATSGGAAGHQSTLPPATTSPHPVVSATPSSPPSSPVPYGAARGGNTSSGSPTTAGSVGVGQKPGDSTGQGGRHRDDSGGRSSGSSGSRGSRGHPDD